MKHYLPHFLALLVVILVVAGCATGNVNPSAARAHTGYVDFYDTTTNDFYWQIERYDVRKQSFKIIYDDMASVTGGFLRLALAPGHYQLRITIMNRATKEPPVVEVDVQDGMITPVQVEFVPDGVTQIQNQTKRAGVIVGHQYGVRTQYSSSEATLYKLLAEVEPPTPYRVKAQTDYAQ